MKALLKAWCSNEEHFYWLVKVEEDQHWVQQKLAALKALGKPCAESHKTWARAVLTAKGALHWYLSKGCQSRPGENNQLATVRISRKIPSNKAGLRSRGMSSLGLEIYCQAKGGRKDREPLLTCHKARPLHHVWTKPMCSELCQDSMLVLSCATFSFPESPHFKIHNIACIGKPETNTMQLFVLCLAISCTDTIIPA